MSPTHTKRNDGRAATSIPRWVMVFAIIFAILIVLFGFLHLTGNSLGGPGSHTPFIEHSIQQP